MLGVQLLIMGLLGTLAAVIASRKGRSVVGWFFGGFFLGLIGVVIVAVLPNLKKENDYRRHVREQQRRIREQVRQERIKAEAFRRYTTRRLDTHDQTLGIDTRSADALPTEAPPRQLPAAPPPPPTAKMWYYEDSGEALGPVSIVQMRNLAKAGQITGQTLVWSDGMADWVPLAQLAELRARVLA